MLGMEEKELRLLGASCRTAPVEVRESLSNLVAETEARFLPDEPEELELVVLSTCNRTEIYTSAPIQTDYLDRWFRQIADSLRPGSASSNETLYHLRGESAARHLFRVACGLDSAVLGDVQILSQIKQARTAAKEARRLGIFLERLFQVAIQAGKRARHESEIGYGAASVGSALASMLRLAKVSVVSSALLGTINGSAIANVVTVGSFTIPLMKRSGFSPAYAAAVEATASMGGQLMPPIMGVAAFLMADMLAIPYARIAAAAIIPAFLYFFAAGAMIHFRASREGHRGLTREELPRLGPLLFRRGYLSLPVAALLYLLFSGYTPTYAAVYAILFTVLVAPRGRWWILENRRGSPHRRLSGAGESGSQRLRAPSSEARKTRCRWPSLVRWWALSLVPSRRPD